MKKDYAEYLLRETKEKYNLIAEEFARYREKPWPEAKFLVDEYAIPGERILDLGCGVGQWYKFFNKKEVDYTGADFSEKLIEIAKIKYSKAKFKVTNVINLPFPDNYFDKVYAIALFHHIPSKEFQTQLLKEIKRVLKPDGLLILTVWNLWQKWRTRKIIFKFGLLKILGKSKLDFGDILMDWQGMKNCYFHCFTKKKLLKLIREINFNLIKDGEFLVGAERKFTPRLSNSNFYIIAQKTIADKGR